MIARLASIALPAAPIALAAAILANGDADLATRLKDWRAAQTARVAERPE